MSHARSARLLAALLLLAGCASAGDLESPVSGTAPPATTNAATTSATTPALDDLVGTWDIALFFSPGAPPSTTVMEIASVQDGAVAGSFYGSAFEEGRATIHRGEVVLFAVTSDGSGPYAPTGRLRGDGTFEGQTLSTGRDFVMTWEATRRTASSNGGD